MRALKQDSIAVGVSLATFFCVPSADFADITILMMRKTAEYLLAESSFIGKLYMSVPIMCRCNSLFFFTISLIFIYLKL